jgi:DNA-binding transcriptional regulator LsrR (DeoR family)
VSTSATDYEGMRLMARVLTLYYEDGRNQAQVAKELGLSTAKVNRLIKRAKDQGLVEIRIHTPFQTAFGLEDRLKSSFGLQDAEIVPKLSDEPGSEMTAIGRAGSTRLLQSLRDGDVICISGGKAVYDVVKATEPKVKYDVTVVPATGGVQGAHHTDVNFLASELAGRLGGRAYQLHAPIFVDSAEEKRALLNVRQIREVLDRARQADIALVGVGGVIPGTSSFFDLLSSSDVDREAIIQNEAARGDLFGHLFDEDGSPCAPDLSDRLIGVDIDDARSVPLSIGVAAGAQKVEPVSGILRGGYLKSLVTDEPTASAVLEMQPTLEPGLKE